MNKIVIDCYNHFDESEQISILVDDDIDINNLEFILKKKLNIKPDKHMKIYIHHELNNKSKKVNELHTSTRLKIYYLVMDSPKPIRNCNNILFCAVKRY